MKTLKISNEVCKNLSNNLNGFCTNRNKVRFALGVRTDEVYMDCVATIVNGNSMVKIGFKVEKPRDYDTVVKEVGALYATFNVSADQFCTYMSSLINYERDISLEIAEKKPAIILSAGSDAKVPLPTVQDSEVEPELPDDKSESLVNIMIDGNKFFKFLKRGGFLASSKEDSRFITDRVAFCVSRESQDLLYAYSANIKAISQTWLPVECRFMTNNLASLFLKLKMNTLSIESKKLLENKIKEIRNPKDPSELLAIARDEGYDEKQYLFSIPYSAMAVIRSIVANAEKVAICVTANNIHILAGNVLATFSLAGTVSPVYSTVVVGWGNNNWDVKMRVDSEAFHKSVALLNISKEQEPIRIEVKDKLTCSKGELVTKINIDERGGKKIPVSVSVAGDNLRNILGNIDNGNLIICIMQDIARNPICFRNGDLDGNDISHRVYALPVVDKQKNEETGGNETEQ